MSAELIWEVHIQKGYADPLERIIERLPETVRELRASGLMIHLVSQWYIENKPKFIIHPIRFPYYAKHPEDPIHKRAVLSLPMGKQNYGCRIPRDPNDFLFYFYQCWQASVANAKVERQTDTDLIAGEQKYFPPAAVVQLVSSMAGAVPRAINGQRKLPAGAQGKVINLKEGMLEVMKSLQANPFGRRRRKRRRK